jgi:CRISPR system Cascade subunit CasD
MKYLKIHLSGVLQYFSSNQSTTLRSSYVTETHPTKRAVFGLIGSAMGFERGNKEQQNYLKDNLVVKYKSLKDDIMLLEDYQTVSPLKSQQYYMNKHYKRNTFKTMDGSKGSEEAIIKKIQYLQNAEFEVYVGGDEKILKEIYEALRNPVYALFFGKRSCVPNKPLVTKFELIKEEDLENVFDCA